MCVVEEVRLEDVGKTVFGQYLEKDKEVKQCSFLLCSDANNDEEQVQGKWKGFQCFLYTFCS